MNEVKKWNDPLLKEMDDLCNSAMGRIDKVDKEIDTLRTENEQLKAEKLKAFSDIEHEQKNYLNAMDTIYGLKKAVNGLLECLNLADGIIQGEVDFQKENGTRFLEGSIYLKSNARFDPRVAYSDIIKKAGGE